MAAGSSTVTSTTGGTVAQQPTQTQPHWAQHASNGKRRASNNRKEGPCFDDQLLDHTTLDSKLAKNMKLCAIDSWNMNAWSTGNEAAGTSSADCIALQETKTTDKDVRDRQECAKNAQGWNAKINNAVQTEDGGRSSGVAIMIKKHIGMSTNTNGSISAKRQSRIAAA